MTQQRDISFDILKGILILLVIVGHAIADTYVQGVEWQHVTFDFIYTFHMPLFIMVSGYFAHSMAKRSFGEVVHSRAKRIMLPWFIWSTVLVVIYYSSTKFQNDPLIGLGANAKELYRMYTEIWYLVCIFILSMFWYPFAKALNSTQDTRKWAICALLLMLWGGRPSSTMRRQIGCLNAVKSFDKHYRSE